MNRPESSYQEPVVNVSPEPVYAIFDQAPAPAVPPAMSKRSRALPAAPLNEYMYRPSRMSASSAHFGSQVFPAQFALIPVPPAAERAVVGDITVQAFPDIEYLYTVTALFPRR